MRVELTGDIIERMKAELIRGQSLEGACRFVGITSSSCNEWRSAGEALLDGRPHRAIPNEPKKYAYKDDNKYNNAYAKYENRCSLLAQFFLKTESGRGEVSGYMMDILFRLIERGDIQENDKIWLPIFTYLSRAYRGEWSETVKVDKSVEIKHEINVSNTLDEVNRLYADTAQMEAVKRLQDESISEEDADDLKNRLRRLGGSDLEQQMGASEGDSDYEKPK